MVTISATEFKATCLHLLDRVKATGETIQITKRGKVVAELSAPREHTETPVKAGFARETIKIYGDIVSPLDETWEALK